MTPRQRSVEQEKRAEAAIDESQGNSEDDIVEQRAGMTRKLAVNIKKGEGWEDE